MLGKATTSKTRTTTAKLRVEIDLARPIMHEITVEIMNHDENIEIFLAEV